MAGTTGLEPATSDVTGRRSNQLNYVPACGLTLTSYHGVSFRCIFTGDFRAFGCGHAAVTENIGAGCQAPPVALKIIQNIAAILKAVHDVREIGGVTQA